MDLQHIANLEAVAEAATGGRWITSVPAGFNQPWGVVAQLEDCTLDILCDTDADISTRIAMANALFIATARQAVPELCAALRVQKEIAEGGAREIRALRGYIQTLLNDLLNDHTLPVAIHTTLWKHRQTLSTATDASMLEGSPTHV